MNTAITDEQAMAAAAIIKEYAAAQQGCHGCAFALAESARCIISPSGCACAWKLPHPVEGSSVDVENTPVYEPLKPGDVCSYPVGSNNKSQAIVEIVRILEDPRGVAEIKFLDVSVDDTGNGYFGYLLRTGLTMNASLQYLQRR